MEYGLIGNPLKHSFSKGIHSFISNYTYELCELSENELDLFMKNKDFKGINVTIPYKQKVIPYLDYIDEDAKNINAVNTIVNIDNKLYGYNTDILGVLGTFAHNNINVNNKNVLILGTGATSNTVSYAVKKCKAKNVYKTYRKGSKILGDILYEDIDNISNDINIIINTTSVGMYPHTDDKLLINTNLFKNLENVIDVVYNPIRTRLLLDAEKNNIKTSSGLYMLIAQAYFASILFKNKTYNNNVSLNFNDKNVIEQCNIVYNKCRNNKLNIVLTGMPTCGKTTIAKIISEKYNYEFIDTDELIEQKINTKIVDFINNYGEEKFRDIESEIIDKISTKNHSVIATGGGAILKNDNVLNLKLNGKIFFINRSLKNLKPTTDRPLTSDYNSLQNKFNERLPIYKQTCDYEIDGDIDIDERITQIFNNL
ncbi:MAG: shikimate dehydrogenase [Lachnospiraceae bacterium]|nr:shikimate dehydrogenase [Lachnospiraceae bacterium]